MYKQKNAGLSWVIVTEYNKSLDEFIVYDPMYYTKLPKTRDWERIVNTPKKRYISFRSKYFLMCWKKTSDTVIYSGVRRANSGIKPFFREFLAIAKADM